MLEIKRLLPDQWTLLREVRLRALRDAPEAFCTRLADAQARSEAQWQENARRFAALPPAASYFAFFNDAPCGMVNCFVSQEDSQQEDGQTAELTAFWVAPERRGLGIGHALVAAAAEWATAQGAAALQAWVVEDNYPAIDLYHKVGFSDTGRRQPHTPDLSKQIILLARTL